MSKKPFLLGVVASLFFTTAISYGDSTDKQISRLLPKVRMQIGQIENSATKLASYLGKNKNEITWERHHSELTQIADRLDELAKLIPETLRDGRYVMVPLRDVWVTQIVATIESLNDLAHDALQIVDKTQDVTRLVNNPDYHRMILVIDDFSENIEKLMQ